MVEGMSVVANVMLFLMSIMSSPLPYATYRTHGGAVMYFRCDCFRGEFGFPNCDDNCMCIVNKQFELLEFLNIPFMLTCNMMRFSHFYCWVCVLVLCL